MSRVNRWDGFRAAPALFALMSAALLFCCTAVSAQVGPPPGYFYLQSTVQDKTHAFGVMDAANTAGMVNGFIQINQPANSATQYWEEVRPISSDGQTFGLKNSATGQCLADSQGDSAIILLRPCSDPSTLWTKFLGNSGTVRFRRTTKSVFKDIQTCLGKDVTDPTFVLSLTCYDDSLVDAVFWTETTEPLGTSSSASIISVPPVPPDPPADCQMPSGQATCGLVEFSCKPFSATNTMLVASGRIGVKVTDVQPNEGIVVGSYLNTGKASVAVCATRSGLSACGAPIDVNFGAIVCAGGSSGHTCPRGTIHCGAGCAPPSPECFPK